MKNDRAVLLLITFFAGAIGLAVLTTLFAGYFNVNNPVIVKRVDQPPGGSVAATASPSAADQGNPLLDLIADNSPVPSTQPQRSAAAETVEIIQRLLLAVILSGILAFRPRKNVPLFHRSLFVSQTQILLAVVAAALMLIVGDNAARAFAIFAAVSLVRFRTNIRDPKEITVLLISLALGLAAGVGRWDLGIALCLFALALLWLLEFNETSQTFRSMELTVKTRDPERTQEVLVKIFKRLKIDAEVREIIPPDEKKQVGSITYYLNLRLDLTTDKLSDRIMAADPDNTEGIQWSKTKNAADIYQ
ncbi:MAG: DUF4956 domain-containing protein [Pyrinomonadaceae bacterium]